MKHRLSLPLGKLVFSSVDSLIETAEKHAESQRVALYEVYCVTMPEEFSAKNKVRKFNNQVEDTWPMGVLSFEGSRYDSHLYLWIMSFELREKGIADL